MLYIDNECHGPNWPHVAGGFFSPLPRQAFGPSPLLGPNVPTFVPNTRLAARLCRAQAKDIEQLQCFYRPGEPRLQKYLQRGLPPTGRVPWNQPASNWCSGIQKVQGPPGAMYGDPPIVTGIIINYDDAKEGEIVIITIDGNHNE